VFGAGYHQKTTQQLWPEVDLFNKLNQKFRLLALVSGTRLNKSYYSEGSFAIHLDYFAFPRVRKINRTLRVIRQGDIISG
jgi:hypothetical protein